jgi:fructokinase
MQPQFIGLGEVLWDELPGGRQLGGAPANFAYHAAALGARAQVVSRVGRDPLGAELLARLQQLGLATDTVELDPAAPTGTVTVSLGADGQPGYTIHESVAWDFIAAEPAGLRAVAAADAICFGTLAQRSARSRASIHSLLRQARRDALRIFDVNLRQHYYSRELIEHSLSLANVLKVNETELPLLAALFQLSGNEAAQVAEIARRFALRAVAFTRGGRGSLLYADGITSEHAGQPVQVADTVGAGDSFTAAFALGLLREWPLDTINQRATAIASYVCSQTGATPILPEELRAPFLAS